MHRVAFCIYIILTYQKNKNKNKRWKRKTAKPTARYDWHLFHNRKMGLEHLGDIPGQWNGWSLIIHTLRFENHNSLYLYIMNSKGSGWRIENSRLLIVIVLSGYQRKKRWRFTGLANWCCNFWRSIIQGETKWVLAVRWLSSVKFFFDTLHDF